MPYQADSKALLQPVPVPASFCIRQTDPWVGKNSARRVTGRPRGTRCHHRGTRQLSFSHHANTSTAKGEITGIEAKGCFQNSAKGLWQVLVAGNSTQGPSRAG